MLEVIIDKNSTGSNPFKRPRSIVCLDDVGAPSMVRVIIFGEREMQLMKGLKNSARAARQKTFGGIDDHRNSSERVS